MYKRFFKRLLDISVSFTAILVLMLPLLVIALAIKIDSKGPVLFKQNRLGKNGKVFRMLKFRSMCVGAETQGSGVYSEKGDARVTAVGRVLRATSLDELPQLLSVLKGDMTFVGPRPPLTYHPWPWEEYTEEQRKMFSVRPGITGWAQVNGRKTVEWHRRIELNVWYAEHVSFALDVKIFFLTLLKVLKNADNENIGKSLQSPEEETSAGEQNTEQENEAVAEAVANGGKE